MPPIIITESSSTWTLAQITHPDGGTINGYMQLSTGGSWYWTCSAAEGGGRLTFGASGTVPASTTAGAAKAAAEANLRKSAQCAYDIMTVVT